MIIRGIIAGVVTAALLPALSGCTESSESLSRKLAGRWTLEAESGARVSIEFVPNGAYYLYKTDVIHSFVGSYEVNDDVIRLVDIYCGTKLPGLYRFSLKGSGDKAELTLERIEDERCTRGDFMPGTWRRTGGPASERPGA